MYVQKLRAKRQLLGLWVPEEGGAAAPSSSDPSGAPASAGKKRKRGAADTSAAEGAAAGGDAAAEDGEGPEDAAAAAAGGADLSTHEQQQEDESEAAVRAVLDGAVAAVVYRNAVKADMDLVNWATQLCSGSALRQAEGTSNSPDSLQQALAAAVVAEDAPGRLLLQAAFLQVLQQYSFGGAQRLAQEIVEDISNRYPQVRERRVPGVAAGPCAVQPSPASSCHCASAPGYVC